MGIFGKKHPNFFSPKEEKEIVSAIKSAEKTTSGEVRVHLDEDEVDDMKERAVYIFDSLGMKNTEARNGILIYLHPSQKNFLVMGDEGIHAKVGQEFWENISKDMKTHFQKEEFALGVISAIDSIGKELQRLFPYDADTDENELGDEISYKV